MKTLTARILVVNCVDPDTNYEYSFRVEEFSNGLILVGGETSNDWFFRCREEIKASGYDLVVGGEDTEDITKWTPKELNEAWGNSVAEFSDLSCIDLVKELLFS